MAIKTVRAQVNGTWHTLTYDSASGTYKATITAPGATSFHQSGGYYNVTVEATNDAGTTVSANGVSLSGLQLFVRERVAPVIAILSPSSGAYVSTSTPNIVFNVTDETGGSGVDTSSIVVKIDGAAVSNITTTAITNGYSVTATPGAALSDGSHTVTVDVSDNDGNAATQQAVTFTVDTVPPTLNITSPGEGYITNNKTVNVAGTTNDVTSSPVTIKISLNGTDQGAVTVATNGSFAKSVTLAEGENTIVITATDAAGRVSTVSRTVKLDTSVPAIQSAVITPNPVDAGATMIISVVIA